MAWNEDPAAVMRVLIGSSRAFFCAVCVAHLPTYSRADNEGGGGPHLVQPRFIVNLSIPAEVAIINENKNVTKQSGIGYR